MLQISTPKRRPWTFERSAKMSLSSNEHRQFSLRVNKKKGGRRRRRKSPRLHCGLRRRNYSVADSHLNDGAVKVNTSIISHEKLHHGGYYSSCLGGNHYTCLYPLPILQLNIDRSKAFAKISPLKKKGVVKNTAFEIKYSLNICKAEDLGLIHEA